jgi:hypothetical protein
VRTALSLAHSIQKTWWPFFYDILIFGGVECMASMTPCYSRRRWRHLSPRVCWRTLYICSPPEAITHYSVPAPVAFLILIPIGLQSNHRCIPDILPSFSHNIKCTVCCLHKLDNCCQYLFFPFLLPVRKAVPLLAA